MMQTHHFCDSWINRARAAGPSSASVRVGMKIEPALPPPPPFDNSISLQYIKRLFVTDEHVEMIWNGLCRAGMKELE